jgi:single-strand DNA-binding protein
MTTVIDAANVAVVRGQLSGAPRTRQLPSGSALVEFDVTTRDDEGTSSVPVVWFEPGALAESLEQGSAVLVVGFVRRRFFRTAAGTQSRTEVVARRVVGCSRRAQVARTLADVAAAIAGH